MGADVNGWTSHISFGKMIKMIVKEYRENDIGIKDTIITFLGIPIFKYTKTTTNYTVVALLTPKVLAHSVKGFKDEVENKNKENK